MDTDNGVGWYGKVPSVGDFVRRGLPDRFVDVWDDWLQRAVLAGRRVKGAPFDVALAAFPTWRFLIAPGVIGPCAWCGVMQASRDRVGRTFPFTVAQALEVGDDWVCDTAWLESQLEAFARTAVSALDEESLERFERLAASLAGALPEQQAATPVESLSRLARGRQAPVVLDWRLNHWMQRLGERDLTRLLVGRCLWWIPPVVEEEPGAALLAEHPLPDDLLLTLFDAV